MTDKVQDNFVVTLDYTLIVEDEVLESTNDGEPIEFIQGIGQIIPGLEEALYDMKVGDEKTVVIEPEGAYGEYDPDSLEVAKKEEFSEEIPLEYDPDSLEVAKKEEFSEEIPLDVGTFLDLRDDQDEILSAQIIEADEDTVTLDFNHPLAGKTLTFEITVSALRPATAEELEHGHVH
ncbi:MAG: peptidylprolyl isomerase [Anaerolineales bacterium]